VLNERNIHKSVMAWVRSSFTAAPYSMTVYGESDLRAVQTGALKPVSPRLFVLEAYMRPTEPTLPMCVIETGSVEKAPFELGNRKGRKTTVQVHLLGRMVGERKDLASVIGDAATDTGYMPVNDYTSGSGVFVENGLIGQPVRIEEYALKRDDLRQDSALDLWSIVSFELMTTR
jgi:hypothetical protein